MSKLTKRERIRRVILLCAHFSRNLAYYRAGHELLTTTSLEFWITVDGNFLDVAVIEWCKLLGDPKEKHHWKRIVTDASRFEADLLGRLGVNTAEFAAYINEVRAYRDKFIAHLDDLREIDIPLLDRAKAAVEFLHDYVVLNEAAPGDLAGLPNNLSDYYDHCFAEATAAYKRSGVTS